MFKAPFSFKGRIRRMEYFLTIILPIIGHQILTSNDVQLNLNMFTNVLTNLVYIMFIWLTWSQGFKRCHDLGRPGYFLIIPFYIFWMIFADGEKGANQYGDNPKNLS